MSWELLGFAFLAAALARTAWFALLPWRRRRHTQTWVEFRPREGGVWPTRLVRTQAPDRRVRYWTLK